MTFTRKLLRLIDPVSEDLRMEMRHSMSALEAHTEDLNRTVVLDGDAIRKAIERFRNRDPEATIPNGH